MPPKKPSPLRLPALALALALTLAPTQADDARQEALADLLTAYDTHSGNIDNILKLKYAVNDAVIASTLQSLAGESFPTFGAGEVKIYEFSDYQCGYCRRVFTALDAAAQAGDATIALIEYPILGDMSNAAARHALAAHKQGKFALFHRRLMGGGRPITDDLLRQTALESGLNMPQLERDLNAPAISAQLEQNFKLAALLKITGTPALIINNTVYRGALREPDLKRLITQAK